MWVDIQAKWMKNIMLFMFSMCGGLGGCSQSKTGMPPGWEAWFAVQPFQGASGGGWLSRCGNGRAPQGCHWAGVRTCLLLSGHVCITLHHLSMPPVLVHIYHRWWTLDGLWHSSLQDRTWILQWLQQVRQVRLRQALGDLILSHYWSWSFWIEVRCWTLIFAIELLFHFWSRECIWFQRFLHSCGRKIAAMHEWIKLFPA